LFLGVLPISNPLFWLVLPLPIIANARLLVVGLAAAAGYLFYPHLDSLVEPIGIAILRSELAHAWMVQLTRIPLFSSLQWYNTIIAAYTAIFLSGAAAFLLVRQAFRIGTALGASRDPLSHSVLVVEQSYPRAGELLPERALLADMTAIQETVQSAVPTITEIELPSPQFAHTEDRKLVVHEGHSLQSCEQNHPKQETAVADEGQTQPILAQTTIELHNQIWEVPCFVENEVENHLLDDLLQSMPQVVSAAEQTIGIESLPVSDLATASVSPPSKKNNKKRRKVTVKETIIDIVRWKKPSVQSSRTISSDAVAAKANSANKSTSVTAPPMVDSKVSSAQSDTNLQQLTSSTIVMASEPLPYLMGYLSNLNRSSEKSGGR
jgi:hypothetical protein